ncbi:hypothetical protein WJX73_009416 [Symbiochloris irregularis]|uniref:Amine oxidase domain-containing protein n=1 Tax=Symbiochloris irregularis TaxID=706552 RepID=A0AAW1NY89_9CHLO
MLCAPFWPRVEELNKEVLRDSKRSQSRSHVTDVVVIGSGIGGLCCAAMLAKYGVKVTVCESHDIAGGAAHAFQRKGYSFDSGPSFFAGLSGPKGKSINPLKQVLDVVGAEVACKSYDRWITYTPTSTFPVVADGAAYAQVIRQEGGEEAGRQWDLLSRQLLPLQEAAAALPTLALRADPGAALTLGGRLPSLARAGLVARDLTAPFSRTLDKVVTNPWLRKFMDLECFVLSGMMAQDTIAAEMAMMLSERNAGHSTIDYPLGGSGAIVEALMKAILDLGGRVLLGAHVDEVLVEGGKASGVRLKASGSSQQADVVTARQAVVSNASVWDTLKLLPSSVGSDSWRRESAQTPATDSFMHLHLGIDAKGLPEDLQGHHLVINDWDNLSAPQNVCIISIPTQFDPSLAPEGKAVVHAYVAANEPFSIWKGMDRKSEQYKNLKEERSQVLWRALERVIPDIRQRTEVKMVGSPLTHARYLNRHEGTYGAAISAATGSFPGPQTPIKGLYRCGDSTAPGIGVPAAAASGMICANTLVPVWSHLKMLQQNPM